MREIKFRVFDKLEKRMRLLNNGHDSLWFGRGYARYSNLQNGSGGDEYILRLYCSPYISIGYISIFRNTGNTER